MYINDLDHSTYTPLVPSKSVHKVHDATIKYKYVEYEVIIIIIISLRQRYRISRVSMTTGVVKKKGTDMKSM